MIYNLLDMVSANVWVFLLAGIIITGVCKYNKKNN
ncbi:hypothetical protein L1282_002573 [Chryseobacterium sp. HSC-36S06]|nr:hypothetical protein [Chryseobacterium sp. HSC-36S06]